MTAHIRFNFAALASAGIWAANLLDAWGFHGWAVEYFADTQSINASNDLGLANGLLCTAVLAVAAVGLVVTRTLAGRAMQYQGWLLVLLFLMGIWWRLRDPAHPIVLFPTMDVLPLLPAAAWCTAVALLPPWSRVQADHADAGAKGLVWRGPSTESPNSPADRA